MPEESLQSAFETPRAASPVEDRRRRHLTDADESASEAVVAAVANAEDADADALAPLEDCLDTESLDSLVDTKTTPPAGGLIFTRTEELATEIEVSFRYAGYDVTVSESYVLLE